MAETKTHTYRKAIISDCYITEKSGTTDNPVIMLATCHYRKVLTKIDKPLESVFSIYDIVTGTLIDWLARREIRLILHVLDSYLAIVQKGLRAPGDNPATHERRNSNNTCRFYMP